MTAVFTPPRRVRVERNIYRRTNAAGNGVFEVGFRDSAGRQRWRVVPGGISAARACRDAILGDRARGNAVQPNPRLRFGEAAEAWLEGQVASLRATTKASYRNSVNTHLRPRWGNVRLDAITVDDVAALVRDLRRAGRAESTIATVLRAASRVFAYAQRRSSWRGENPIRLLETGERPRLAEAPRRRLFSADELHHTLMAANEPFATLFTLAAVTGGRLSELLGLVWADAELGDPTTATVRFAHQVDRAGARQPLKTYESRRTVEIPTRLAILLREHRLRSVASSDDAFIFSTRSGRALGQRNVLRALRCAMRDARDSSGGVVFPTLHDVDRDGNTILSPRGSVPNFHSFRHTAASEAIADGEGAEELSWQLGHKSSNVTRAVYIHEIKTAERSARRRAKLEARYAGVLASLEQPIDRRTKSRGADVIDLRARSGP